jgi:cobyric acid synthase
MGNYKKEIKSMLNKIVGEDLGEKIFEANFPEPIKNYKAGNILTFKQIKELPEGTIIHINYFDEDDNEREDGFQKLSKDEECEEYSAGAFPFPTNEHDDDNDLIENADNSGWTFTIREAIKVSATEFKKIEKQRADNHMAIELINKLRDGEALTKEEKKILKKTTGIRVK